eukprot:CAMPEP_0176140838 /NCGR_PEP_ID=MMETSP0120_2-20121206/71605_1 /TAXON_ID=160619 /ORGANISM="Kryptoperidinium foliaceum, Strain CCMP 1326" /LENGTH=76 /DNA_ID=CAMNT_0017476943 /DNA_START=15 /DNA_END=242 /DNA_ORIENTATION=+
MRLLAMVRGDGEPFLEHVWESARSELEALNRSSDLQPGGMRRLRQLSRSLPSAWAERVLTELSTQEGGPLPEDWKH